MSTPLKTQGYPLKSIFNTTINFLLIPENQNMCSIPVQNVGVVLSTTSLTAVNHHSSQFVLRALSVVITVSIGLP